MADQTEELVRVGKVKDAHGIKGELFIILFAGEAAWLPRLKQLRLVKETVAGQAAEPAKIFAIKSARVHKNGLIAKCQEIGDRNLAETFKGWLLEIPAEYMVSAPGEGIYLREIKGFRVITKHKGEVGTIEAFATNSVQDLLVVRTAWGDFEVPFVEAFVENIDFKDKTIHLDLPEGLLGEFDGESSSGQDEDDSDEDDGSINGRDSDGLSNDETDDEDELETDEIQ